MDTISALLIGAALLWFWTDSMRAREQAMRVSALACKQLELQLLDQSVALARLGLTRGTRGRIQLRRVYRFEFSTDGVERWTGRAVLCGSQLGAVYLDYPDGTVILEANGGGLRKVS